jgi:hypothetical protein
LSIKIYLIASFSLLIDKLSLSLSSQLAIGLLRGQFTDDFSKIRRLQGSATDEEAINVLLQAQLLGVIRLERNKGMSNFGRKRGKEGKWRTLTDPP